jgi:hypothetical protein
VRCGRWAAYGDARLCSPRQGECKGHGRPALAEFAATPLRGARDASIEVDLSAFSERPRLEVPYGLQEIWLDGGYAWRGTRQLQSVVDAVAAAGVGSPLDELVIEGSYRGGLYRQLRVAVELLLADPERELERDVLRLAILRPDGRRQRIDYSSITQPWLRQLVKQWNRQRLISHSVGTLRASVHFAAELSGVLALRADRGEDPSALGRQDAVDFLAHLRGRELSGEISNRRGECVSWGRALLREARERGLHRPPGPAAGLSDQFALYDADRPRAPMRDPEGEPERALPQVVIDQLFQPGTLALLRDTACEAVACAIELQMRIGRRPQEIAHAPFRCLEHEQRVREDGKLEYLPVFVYRPEKRPKTRKELPIFGDERRLIKRMQTLARERFPDADPSRLPLVPRQMRNRDGRQPLPPATLASKMREWVDAAGELTGPDGEQFDRSKVFPHAFRHPYTQRQVHQLGLARALVGQLELERRVGELQTLVDERDREVLALRDSLRKAIRERNTGT